MAVTDALLKSTGELPASKLVVLFNLNLYTILQMYLTFHHENYYLARLYF